MHFAQEKLLVLLFIVFVDKGESNTLPLADETQVLSKLLPNVSTFSEIAKNNGFECEEYDVTTSDGYILQLFRIPGEVKRPVLLMHGIFSSADSYIMNDDESLAFTLARKGYDVWAGNSRGNRYSRRHLTLNPDTDASFWNYTFHEMGVFDLPSMIDLVLNQTGQPQLSAVGHSQGTTIFYVLGAMRPEYNSKINVFASLAPVAHLEHVRGVLPLLIKAAPEINIILEEINYEEVVGFHSNIRALIRLVCGNLVSGYALCFEGVLSLLIGNDPIQIGPKMFQTIVEYLPAGISKKTLLHFSQVGRRSSFAQYDYGILNLDVYGTSEPPEYDLTKVTFDIGLYVGANDYVSTIEDVAILKSKLPNVVDYQIIEFLLWNHFDFQYAKDMPKYLYGHILNLLGKYK